MPRNLDKSYFHNLTSKSDTALITVEVGPLVNKVKGSEFDVA